MGYTAPKQLAPGPPPPNAHKPPSSQGETYRTAEASERHAKIIKIKRWDCERVERKLGVTGLHVQQVNTVMAAADTSVQKGQLALRRAINGGKNYKQMKNFTQAALTDQGDKQNQHQP